MESTALLLSLTSAASTSVFVIVDIVFFVLVVTVVRRARPDAWGLLAAAVGVAILTTFLGFVSGLMGSMYVSQMGGMEAFMRFNIASHLFLALMGVISRVLYIVGVVRLAREPVSRF